MPAATGNAARPSAWPAPRWPSGAPVWLSHVTSADYDRLRASRRRDAQTRAPSCGSGSGKRQATATVLDVHPVGRGERIGYWQGMPADATWSWCPADGPRHRAEATAAATMRQRLVSVATGSMEAVGLALSPFTVQGAKRWFVEPPHMQASMLFLPGKVLPPHVGDEVPVEVRLTTATVDRIVVE
jgi:hypothetical protein